MFCVVVFFAVFIYFFRFFISGNPLPNSDVDKLIDFDTNLFRLAAGRFIPFFFTLWARCSDLALSFDLEKRQEIGNCIIVLRKRIHLEKTANNSRLLIIFFFG